MIKREATIPLTQMRLNAIKPGAKQTDHRDGVVRGLVLRVSPGGAMSWVLIKRIPGEGPKRILLGRWIGKADKLPLKPVGGFRSGTEPLTLKQARDEASRVLAMVAEGRSPSKEKAVAKHLRSVDAERGSLRDLLRDYTAFRKDGSERRAAAGERQITAWNGVVAMLEREAPAILDMKARDVEPAHIVALLRPIFHHGIARPKSGRGSGGRRATGGAQGGALKVQTFLQAAFTYGLSAELSLAHKTVRIYGLSHNPVAPIPREGKSTPGTRALSHAELRVFWLTIDSVVGPVMANLLRFTIASGGQRTHQLAREPWESYDMQKGVLSLVDRKGRGGIVRAHLVPMTPRMAGILDAVKRFSGARIWPWATNERGPIDITSPASAVRRWLASDHAVVDGKRVAPFTPRDLRRTCTQLMQAAGVPDAQADRLQSHGVSGVVAQHYRNAPKGYLPEKRSAIEAFDKVLADILAGKKSP